MVDDLHGKTIGFIICEFKFLEWIKLQQVYEHVQEKDSNFIWIWIPIAWPEDCGHGSYTRLIQCMPWACFPRPQLVNVYHPHPRFVVVDKEGQIANKDALPLLLGWGVESYPFTHHTIPECFSLVESESCLEFLLHGMKIDRRKPMTKKITFLHVAPPDKVLTTMKCRLEELTHFHGSFEVLYVGRFDVWEYGNLKEDYEDATQNMSWLSLSFSDMIMFWYRYKYLANNKMYEGPLRRLAVTLLYLSNDELVLVDNDGDIVTCHKKEMVQMVCESWDGMVKDELILSLSRGECTPLVKALLRDVIDNHTQHRQHRIRYFEWGGGRKCDVCGGGCNQGRTYCCFGCQWFMCGNCWIADAKRIVRRLRVLAYVCELLFGITTPTSRACQR